ncbi:MAG: Coenzyme F420 hydrogenase/dehydrogenase, beta subunit C-terminal domain [Rikenellaceae bacterium]
MIEIVDKRDCCGCGACAQVCPTRCITMREDSEGFLYPTLDLASCIGCSRCEEVCPVINQSDEREPIKVLGAKNRDDKVRGASSSGGVFSGLSEETISKGGVVVAASFDKAWEVEHTVAQSIEECAKFRGSKYMQSRIGDNLLEIQRFLQQGRVVLFCGTPCQVAALKLFLGGDTEGLTTVDFVCHGTPSPKVWRGYLDHITEDKASISAINFRDKSRGWKEYRFTLTAKDQSINQKASDNIFMRGFFQDLLLRPSCHHCPTRGLSSGSDITLGDFWGVERVARSFDDKGGVSLVLLNSQRGVEAIERVENIESFEAHYPTVVKYNPSIVRSAAVPTARAQFFENVDSGMIQRLEQLTYVSPTQRGVRALKLTILELLPLPVVEWLERRKMGEK